MATAEKQPDLSDVYGRKLAPVTLGNEDFRITALRPQGTLDLGGITESLSWRWDEGDPILRGDVQMRKPDSQIQPLTLVDGHVLRLEVRWFDAWREVWRMRLADRTFDPITGALSFNLADDLSTLQLSTDDFNYVKSKKANRPHGWYCHEIVRDIARRYRIPLGKIAAGKHRIKKLSMKGVSPLAAIQKAYSIERTESGRRFVIGWKNGRLEILPMRRNPQLYALREQLISAPVKREDRDEKFATAVTVRGTVGRGKKKRKIAMKVSDERAVGREGFVHRVVRGGNFDTEAKARSFGKRYIAKHGMRKRTVDIEHVGLPFVRRGDAMQISLPEAGLTGASAFMFVKNVSWSLSGGNFTMQVGFALDDPYFAYQQERDARALKLRKEKAKKKS